MPAANLHRLRSECVVKLNIIDATAKGKFPTTCVLSPEQHGAFLDAISTLLRPDADVSETFEFNVVVVASYPVPGPSPEREIEADVAQCDAPDATGVEAHHDGGHCSVDAIENAPAVCAEPLERADDAPLVEREAEEEQQKHQLPECEMDTGDDQLAEEQRVDPAPADPIEPARVSEPDCHEYFAPTEIAIPEKQRKRKRPAAVESEKKVRKVEIDDGSVDGLIAAMTIGELASDPARLALVEKVRDWARRPSNFDSKLPARLCAAGTKVMGEDDFMNIAAGAIEWVTALPKGKIFPVPKKFTKVLASYARAAHRLYEPMFRAVLCTALEHAENNKDLKGLRRNYFDTEFLSAFKEIVEMEAIACTPSKAMTLGFVRRALFQSTVASRFGYRCNFDAAATILLMILDGDMFTSFSTPSNEAAYLDIKNLGAVCRVMLEGNSNTHLFRVEDADGTAYSLDKDTFFRGCVEANGMFESLVAISWTISENVPRNTVEPAVNSPVNKRRTDPKYRTAKSFDKTELLTEIMSRIKRPWLDADELLIEASNCDVLSSSPEKIKMTVRMAHKKHFAPKPYSKQCSILKFLFCASRGVRPPHLPFSPKDASVAETRLNAIIAGIKTMMHDSAVKFVGVFGAPTIFTNEYGAAH